MTFIAIVACARNRVIGDGEKLLWHLPDDLQRVKKLTMGKPLIMGRATFDSIGKPLAGRGNIVLTRKRDYAPQGAIIAHDSDAAIALAAEWIEANNAANEIIIFGGGEIYAAFMPCITRIEMTEVDCAPDGAAKFPEINPDDWREQIHASHAASGDTPAFTYKTLTRK